MYWAWGGGGYREGKRRHHAHRGGGGVCTCTEGGGVLRRVKYIYEKVLGKRVHVLGIGSTCTGGKGTGTRQYSFRLKVGGGRC
jgi:hypothetical protein